MVEADLQRQGYGVLAGGVPDRLLRDIRALLVQEAETEQNLGRASMDGGGANQRVWQLINRGDAFVELATAPPVVELLSRVVGQHRPYGPANDDLPHFLLSNLTANITGPGGEPMPLHSDQYYVPLPWPDHPLVVNIIWALDDFTASNGATRVVPGSHLEQRHPQPSDEADAVPIEVPAGSAVILDGRVWHGTGANRTIDERRHGILAYYCKPWLRQQENFTVSTRDAVVASASPTLRRLLGFDTYRNLGLVHSSRD